MKILIADDDSISRALLQATLKGWGFEVTSVADGHAALLGLQGAEAPKLAILDWMMPGLDGVEVCRQFRALPAAEPAYLILLTARNDKEDIVAGLQNGADDYITKPFDRAELKARLQVGRRIVDLQQTLTRRVQDLEEALTQVKQLQGLLPICSYCKKIRDDKNYWQQIETYFADKSDVLFSHGICPDCLEQAMQEVRNISHTKPAAH